MKKHIRQFIGLAHAKLRSSLRLADFQSQYLVRTISSNEQCFFGYHDVSPFVFNDSSILLGMTSSYAHSPKPGEELVVAIASLNSGEIRPLDSTLTWCWQQGCRLQPLNSANYILFNKQHRTRHAYGSVLLDLLNPEDRVEFDFPVYSISHDDRLGLTLNFSRLQRLRPGYGYSLLPDETASFNAPSFDGVFLCDLKSGERNLLLSLKSLEAFDHQPSMESAQHYVNHLSFSPDSSTFVFFHLWQSKVGRFGRMLASNMRGDLKQISIPGTPSHFSWIDPERLMVTYRESSSGKVGYFIHFIHKLERVSVLPEILKTDGHPWVFGGTDRMVTDTYPDFFARQTLLTIDFKSKSKATLGVALRNPPFNGEYRCDFHPRINKAETLVAIDDIESGRRVVRILRLNKQ